MTRILIFLFTFSIFSCRSVPKSEEEITKEIKFLIEKLSSPAGESIRGISVVDSHTVWLSGAKGTIIKSVNGGKKWEKLVAPDVDSLDFRDVHAFSSQEAVIMSSGSPARVYRTTNGGKSWTKVFEDRSEEAFMNSVTFNGSGEGVIIGDQQNGRHMILLSENNGESWMKVDTSNIPLPLEVENGFAASGSCIAISKEGHFFIGLGGEQSRVFSSVNGSEWKAYATPMVSGSSSSGIYSIAYGNGLLMAVGGDYTMIDSLHQPVISADGGKSWKKAPGKVNGYRSVIDYCTKEKLWLCGGSNGIDFSGNNGNSWTKIADEGINTLQFIPGSSMAFAANGKGEVFLIDLRLHSTKK